KRGYHIVFWKKETTPKTYKNVKAENHNPYEGERKTPEKQLRDHAISYLTDHAAKKSTAFNRDALGLASWTPVHTVGIHCATMHGILCIQ
ncbi:hypothetical protein PS028_23885, partial [Shigella sonnei]|nr:hypothetical protein [Shigella sonnei]